MNKEIVITLHMEFENIKELINDIALLNYVGEFSWSGEDFPKTKLDFIITNTNSLYNNIAIGIKVLLNKHINESIKSSCATIPSSSALSIANTCGSYALETSVKYFLIIYNSDMKKDVRVRDILLEYLI